MHDILKRMLTAMALLMRAVGLKAFVGDKLTTLKYGKNGKKVLAIGFAPIAGILCALIVTIGPTNAYAKVVDTLGIKANPAPTCADPYVFNPKTGTCDKATVTNVTAVVGGKSVSAQSVASGAVIFAAEMHIKGVAVNRHNCFWTKKGQKWQNGYSTAGGVVYHTETTPAQLCHSRKSPTGLVKVAGGETHRRCFNFAKLGPGPEENVTIIIVNNFKVTIPLKAEVSVEVEENGCKASASAMASAKIVLSKFIKIIRTSGKVDVKVFESAIISLSTAVHAEVNCPPTTTVTVTTPGGGTTTTVITTTPTTTNTTTTQTTTTNTTTTTPQSPPVILSITTINDVDAGGTSPNFNATVNIPGNDSGTVTFSSTHGSFSQSSFGVSSGITTVGATYIAPSEVPPSGTDTVCVFVRDNTTTKTDGPKCQTFPIKNDPTPNYARNVYYM